MFNHRTPSTAVACMLIASLVSCMPRALAATWKKLSDKVTIDVIQNSFHIDQVWVVKGATRARLLEAAHHLTLSGRYGLYGERDLVRTDVPEELQNYGDGVNAWAHPIFVPTFMGSR